MLDGKRKSVEPMAGRACLHKIFGHLIAQSTWEHTEVMRRIAARAVAVIEPAAWLTDDHPFVRYGHGTAGTAGERVRLAGFATVLWDLEVHRAPALCPLVPGRCVGPAAPGRAR